MTIEVDENGMISVTTTSLQMFHPPYDMKPRVWIEDMAIMRCRPPTVSFYRYLYNRVGEDWLWYERRMQSDEALRTIISDEQVGIYVLYVHGTPAGYFELDARKTDEIELAYFGLLPEFIGKGLGKRLLERAVEKAWLFKRRRVWVHTCSLDHPSALNLYQLVGFTVYHQSTNLINDPRKEGILPA